MPPLEDQDETPQIAPPSRAEIAASGYHSQLGQDLVLDRHVFIGQTGGVFVDVGAHDGVSLNNTYYFEQQRGWTGVCIEPNAAVFGRLQAARTAACVQAAIGPIEGDRPFRVVTGGAEMLSGLESEYDPRHRERIDRETAMSQGTSRIELVPVRRLDTVLRELSITQVDLLSIDVEGGEEGVLDSIRLAEFGVRVVVIENNYASPSIGERMIGQGYQLLARLGWDELYVPTPLMLARPSPASSGASLDAQFPQSPVLKGEQRGFGRHFAIDGTVRRIARRLPVLRHYGRWISELWAQRAQR